MTDSEASTTNDSLLPFAAGIALVLLCVATTGLALRWFLPDWATRGQFGDMFGVLNTGFSGLAFAALVYTLILQRRELRLQRLELSLTRKELEKQAKAQSEHANTAIRAARIAALGSLYQSYATLMANHREQVIGREPFEELSRVHAELKKLLEDDA